MGKRLMLMDIQRGGKEHRNGGDGIEDNLNDCQASDL